VSHGEHGGHGGHGGHGALEYWTIGVLEGWGVERWGMMGVGGFWGSMRVGRGKRLLRSFVRCFFNVLLAKICCRSKFLG
jgi:hypothetical protein